MGIVRLSWWHGQFRGRKGEGSDWHGEKVEE